MFASLPLLPAVVACTAGTSGEERLAGTECQGDEPLPREAGVALAPEPADSSRPPHGNRPGFLAVLLRALSTWTT